MRGGLGFKGLGPRVCMYVVYLLGVSLYSCYVVIVLIVKCLCVGELVTTWYETGVRAYGFSV